MGTNRYRFAATYTGGTYPPDQVTTLVDNLGPGGSALAEPDTLTMRCTVDATAIAAAAATGLHRCVTAATEAGITGDNLGELVALHAATEEHEARQLAGAGMPGAMGLGDVAARLGRSKQQVHALAAQHPQFPAPVQTSSGPIWWAPDIDKFAKNWKPTKGRPRKAA